MLNKSSGLTTRSAGMQNNFIEVRDTAYRDAC